MKNFELKKYIMQLLKRSNQHQVRNQADEQLYQLQAEFDKLHGAYDEELEAADGVRGQLSRLQADYLALKNKYDKDFSGREGELEELK